jgi:ERCC4-type nuclease
MKIVVDYREAHLNSLLISENEGFGFNLITENLSLGDIIIKDDEDNILLVIERKSVNDLASSIKDGRYAEQSYRLNLHPTHNHNIIYLIEGLIRNYSSKFTRIKPNSLYSSVFSLNYYKGFSTFRTIDIEETAKWIILITDKLNREKHRNPYYNNTINATNAENPSNAANPSNAEKPSNAENTVNNYASVANIVKKNNITSDNISTIMLSQIPGVSRKTADTIMKKHFSLRQLIKNMESNNKCLDNISYETTGGKTRRISKTSINNIKSFLICDDNTSIKITT